LFIYPSIKTNPDEVSVTTTGMTPSELNLGAKLVPSSTNSMDDRSAKFIFFTLFPIKDLFYQNSFK
jgi:hypothetical protein